jgi:hypothetical protein
MENKMSGKNYIADFVQVIPGPDLMKDAVIPFSEKYRK